MSPERSRTADCSAGYCGHPQCRRSIAAVKTRVVRFTCAHNDLHKRTSRQGDAQIRELRQSRECHRRDREQLIAGQVPAGVRSAAASLRQSRIMSSDSHVHVTSRTNARATAATHSNVSCDSPENAPSAIEDSSLVVRYLRAPAAPPHHCGSRLMSSDSRVHVKSRTNPRAATATHSEVPTKPAQLVRVPDNALHPTGRVPSTATRDMSATRTRTHACAQSRVCQPSLCAANEAVIAPSSVGNSETSDWKRATSCLLRTNATVKTEQTKTSSLMQLPLCGCLRSDATSIQVSACEMPMTDTCDLGGSVRAAAR